MVLPTFWDYFFARCCEFLESYLYCEVARQPARIYVCVCVSVCVCVCVCVRVLSVLGPLVFSHIAETDASCRWIENTTLPVGVHISINVVCWQATYFSTEQPYCSSWGLSALLKHTSRAHIYSDCLWVQHLCPKNRIYS